MSPFVDVTRLLGFVVRSSIGSRGMSMSKLAMLMSSSCMLLGIFMLAHIVMMRRLIVMMGCCLLVSCRLMMMLTGLMLG
jgi:hypothetical protein